ncbi:MAG: methionine--tRNA ligase [Legionellaceae bacterium]|nr:methionine--tRNA ligase [Legionellaceae bacterium]
MSSKRQLLVTTALPYGNGHLHLGHLVEHIQSDIWVRTQKMQGHSCISICGIDAHGTPMMLKAEQLGCSPEELSINIRKSHLKDFEHFYIDYDVYHTTHSPESEQLVQQIYKKLQDNGDIIQEAIEQAYDSEKAMFLPDRYVKGGCPRCQAPDQYGDNCEACGATYNPTDLINPISTLSGTAPIQKVSEHYFFNLPRYEAFLKQWLQQGILPKEATNKLEEWFSQGLQRWDISRDAPYFGFPIPDAPNKYFYVWLDAPIGYMGAFQHYCDQTATDFNHYWKSDSNTELYHFIGKDIVYFHALFWPAILHGASFRLPNGIFAHGFLTIDGKKMSKSRGTFIEARQYATHLNPEYLRYYIACKLNGTVEDIDIQWDDFIQKINADLVGKIVNIASRTATFLQKYFDCQLADTLPEPALYKKLLSYSPTIQEAYIQRDYAQAMRLIMEAADQVNQYIDTQKPWTLAKDPEQLPQVQAICTQGINLFRLLITFLKPVLPAMAEASEQFLQCAPLDWLNIAEPLLAHTIRPFTPLMQRVDKAQIALMLEAP